MLISGETARYELILNPFSAELFKVDSFMFKIGCVHSQFLKVLDYFGN